jgi:hypothetical protein
MAKDTRKLPYIKCPMYGSWFKKIMKGCHKRMGDIALPYRALGPAILTCLMSDFKWLQKVPLM